MHEFVDLRQVKYRSSKPASDHGKFKRLIKPTINFQLMQTADARTKGFEVMWRLIKVQFDG
ncbi:hypothetical protein GCM10007094_33640 [Pseudovibrio japonicus]|uniref:Transposase n=1 Tax=Pseudovibrio japonicus TaxID=366534 RepID=A0ABQ3EMR0_9HYPH|nr:hypothetical protein GCM10007094_33640 [Pseudovibrio japonicus]